LELLEALVTPVLDVPLRSFEQRLGERGRNLRVLETRRERAIDRVVGVVRAIDGWPRSWEVVFVDLGVCATERLPL